MQRSALDWAQRFRAIPTLGSAAHHREEVVESLIVAMDLDVVAQGRGGVVKSRFDFAELRAQVLRQTSLVERVDMDNYYIRNWSLSLDLKIAFLTVPAVLRTGDDA